MWANSFKEKKVRTVSPKVERLGNNPREQKDSGKPSSMSQLGPSDGYRRRLNTIAHLPRQRRWVARNAPMSHKGPLIAAENRQKTALGSAALITGARRPNESRHRLG